MCELWRRGRSVCKFNERFVFPRVPRGPTLQCPSVSYYFTLFTYIILVALSWEKMAKVTPRGCSACPCTSYSSIETPHTRVHASLTTSDTSIYIALHINYIVYVNTKLKIKPILMVSKYLVAKRTWTRKPN